MTSSAGPEQPKATSQAVLMQAGFTQVAKDEFLVGQAWAGFEVDLRNTLATLAPTGVLTETISAYVVVGRKPWAAYRPTSDGPLHVLHMSRAVQRM